ncbi:MAG: alanine--tRNA ligase [Tenericutes bacterium]|nr:alanine--tRNA ligase [Mycoplasmatota bacterium]
MKTSKEIRDTFLNYFKEHDHDIIPSAPLIPDNDPTILWNNAGVTPLKKYFDGSLVPKNKRMASSQKCIRTNDIESVGDETHHTFFEMLGNFSIGDYFKDEALRMAYELLTSSNYFNFDKNLLYFTIYTGDLESKQIWMNLGVEESHIIELDGNFWYIGEGPCGPDSEIFYDRGEKYDPNKLGIKLLKEDIPNSRYVEIWNNVFSTYNAKDGVARKDYEELPSKNIDTGMGLERMTCIIQGKDSSYDTDLFVPIIEKIEKLSNKVYGNDRNFRIIADHIRTIVFAISDGATFSNEGRGYVLRRLLRRAYRCGKKINISGSFLYKLVEEVVNIMGVQYSNLIDKKKHIEDLVHREEILFDKTLESGERKLCDIMDCSKTNQISGDIAFKLYDTYGFPFELTVECLIERGFNTNKEEFEKCMERQKELARTSRRVIDSMNIQSQELLEFKEESSFVGYEKHEINTTVIGLFKDNKKVNSLNDVGYVVLKETPFYAEKGGQVGDTGLLFNKDTSIAVVDTFEAPNHQHLHMINVIEGSINIGDKITAKINSKRRDSIEKNHSATHLLHKALKDVLNSSIDQAGSRIDEYEIRFDFLYEKKLTDDEIIKVEDLVNSMISNNKDTIVEEKGLDVAISEGAVALFKDKYNDIVRVITMDTSKELCGGTHVNNTSHINRFAIKSYETIGANTYRIFAATDKNIENEMYEAIKPYNDEIIKLLEKGKNILEEANKEGISLEFYVNVDNKQPYSYKDVVYNRKELEYVKDRIKNLEKIYQIEKEQEVLNNIDKFLNEVKESRYKYVVTKVYDYDMNVLKVLVDRLIEHLNEGIIFIANVKGNNVNYICKSNIDIDAGVLIKEASSKSNGNGGGSKTFGQGGGTSIDNLDEILLEIENKIKA